MHGVSIIYKKEGDQLIPANSAEAGKLKLFKMALKDGEQVEVYLTKVEPADKTLGQLAKIHASIKELAGFLGYTPEELKLVIKDKAGLYKHTETGKEYKSFAECTKDELSNAIQICIQVGNDVGYYM